jgi:peptidoglycan/LPS O-acetylase OafA/YrhL
MLIIFDVLRIVAISLIVFEHINSVCNQQFFQNLVGWDVWIYKIFALSIGNIAVLLFIFISGAVLELNKSKITTVSSCHPF